MNSIGHEGQWLGFTNESRPIPQAEDVHSCSYYCERPACIKAQRDAFRDRLDDGK